MVEPTHGPDPNHVPIYTPAWPITETVNRNGWLRPETYDLSFPWLSSWRTGPCTELVEKINSSVIGF
jgi:hypothetical protein